MPLAWLNPAGGLRYHLRALRAGNAWQPFQRQLGAWLERFTPSSERALLVGPSAGYTISDAFLRRFRELTVLEPDPIAARLLSRRVRRLGLPEPEIVRRDALIAPLLAGQGGLPDLLDADPTRCLVFGNVLGQARFLMGEDELEPFKAAFRARIVPRLSGRAWLSFHDRLSGRVAPRLARPYELPARASEAALIELYPPSAEPIELFDHLSDGFFPAELPHCYFAWSIDSTHHHLIEGVMDGA